MKFYQKRGFALVVLVLAILGSCVYGISKKPADLPQVPWGHEDEELQAYYRMMTALRGSSEALRRGGLRVNHSIGEWVLPAGRVRFAESAAPSPTGEVVLMRGGFCLLEPSDPEAHISIE